MLAVRLYGHKKEVDEETMNWKGSERMRSWPTFTQFRHVTEQSKGNHQRLRSLQPLFEEKFEHRTSAIRRN